MMMMNRLVRVASEQYNKVNVSPWGQVNQIKFHVVAFDLDLNVAPTGRKFNGDEQHRIMVELRDEFDKLFRAGSATALFGEARDEPR
jgi:hypothetical protein